MNFYQFIALDDENRASALLDGVLLVDRVVKDNHIFLYGLGGFYVEVYYSILITKIESIRPFKEITDLEPYPDQIGIECF